MAGSRDFQSRDAAFSLRREIAAGALEKVLGQVPVRDISGTDSLDLRP